MDAAVEEFWGTLHDAVTVRDDSIALSRLFWNLKAHTSALALLSNIKARIGTDYYESWMRVKPVRYRSKLRLFRNVLRGARWQRIVRRRGMLKALSTLIHDVTAVVPERLVVAFAARIGAATVILFGRNASSESIAALFCFIGLQLSGRDVDGGLLDIAAFARSMVDDVRLANELVIAPLLGGEEPLDRDAARALAVVNLGIRILGFGDVVESVDMPDIAAACGDDTSVKACWVAMGRVKFKYFMWQEMYAALRRRRRHRDDGHTSMH